VFQQDGVTAHTVKSTQQFVEKKISSYWLPTVLPPSLLNQKPLKYCIIGVLQDSVQVTKYPNAKALQQSVPQQRCSVTGN